MVSERNYNRVCLERGYFRAFGIKRMIQLNTFKLKIACMTTLVHIMILKLKFW